MTNCRRAALLPLACALFACAQPPPPPPPPARAADPLPEPVTEGVYRGTSTRFQADNRACPYPGLVTLRVQDGIFAYRWNAQTMVDVVIAPDGTLSGQSGEIQVTGRATPRLIEGDAMTEACGLHFTATRRRS